MPDDLARMKQLAMRWKRAAPLLAAQRWADVVTQNNARSIDSLNSICVEAIRLKKQTKTSGFVEMCRILNQSKG